MKDLLYFSHANGFPAPTYRTILDALTDRFEICATERIGHDPRYPVSHGWPYLVDELVERVTRWAGHHGRSVWLVGHSLGGFLSLLAAQVLQRHVRGVVMLDSPLLAGWRSPLMRLIQYTGFDHQFTPAGATRHRRNHWPSREAALQHFSSKSTFARWDPQVLSNYVEYGIRELDDGGCVLAFDPRTEYHIYRTMPVDYGRLLKQEWSMPIAFIAGTRSRVINQIGLHETRHLVGHNLAWIEGSHLYPMERPLETTQVLQRMIAQLHDSRRPE